MNNQLMEEDLLAKQGEISDRAYFQAIEKQKAIQEAYKEQLKGKLINLIQEVDSWRRKIGIKPQPDRRDEKEYKFLATDEGKQIELMVTCTRLGGRPNYYNSPGIAVLDAQVDGGRLFRYYIPFNSEGQLDEQADGFGVEWIGSQSVNLHDNKIDMDFTKDQENPLVGGRRILNLLQTANLKTA